MPVIDTGVADAAEGRWHVPDVSFGDWSNVDDADPIEGLVKPITRNQLARYERTAGRKLKGASGDILGEIEARSQAVKEAVLCDRLSRIRNLDCRAPDGSVTQATTGEALVEQCRTSSPGSLIHAIAESFWSAIVGDGRLSDDARGKSRSPRDSISPTPPPASGVAQSVAAPITPIKTGNGTHATATVATSHDLSGSSVSVA